MGAAQNVYPIRGHKTMGQHQPASRGTGKVSAEIVAEWLAAIGDRQDRTAFRHLFEEFAPKIKAYAIKQGMLEHCEELVQEVMINIWRRAAQFDPGKASPSTWIFAIARNARIDYLRKLGRSSAEVHVETDYLWELPGGDEPAEPYTDARRSVQIRESLSKLPMEQRDVIAKVYLEDKSHQRVADELGLPLGTVKSRVRLALQKMNLMLQEVVV